ncbi:hypothetical protein SCUCBS95973_008814 [Sporothrix curviconia]|uniref:Uncharacterized protein n=1 Tax=Sporothrix curviconia TaxID=1260050 RepID=A0ABP0CPR7_9PEZI
MGNYENENENGNPNPSRDNALEKGAVDDKAKATAPLSLAQPTEAETMGYYRDLPSKPRLLGRTSSSTQQWPPPMVPLINGRLIWTRTAMRCLSLIGEHPIRDVWMGYVNVHVLQRPVVVWIGITDNVAWNKIARALGEIRRILDNAGLMDVQSEMRKAVVSLLASPRLFATSSEPFSKGALEAVQPLTTALGHSCAGADYGHVSGALGLFLTSKKPSSTVASNAGDAASALWALTCRHVTLPLSIFPKNQNYNRPSSSVEPELKIITPSNMHMDSTLSAIKDSLIYWGKAALLSLARRVKGGSMCPPIDTELALVPMLRDSQELEEDLWLHVEELVPWLLECPHTLDEARPYLQDNMGALHLWGSYASVESRIVGSIAISPPLTQHTWLEHKDTARPHHWARDWCLLRLDPSKFPENAKSLCYEVDLRGGMDRRRLDTFLKKHMQVGYRFDYNDNHILQLSGFFPPSDIRCPTVLNAAGDECFLVGKRGPATELTWGTPSELMSTLRHYCVPGGPPFLTHEWAVKGTSEGNVFSMNGDSGSVVFSADGRVANAYAAEP